MMAFDGSYSQRSPSLGAMEAGLIDKSATLQALRESRARGWLRVGHASPSDLAPRVLLQGDSWFDFGAHDLADVLQRDHGYSVTSLAISGSTLQDVVAGTLPRNYHGIAGTERITRLEDTVFAIEAVRPQVLLVSAGGNDMGRDALLGFLGPAMLTPAGRRTDALRAQVDAAFRPAYDALISLVQAKAHTQGRRLPIVLQGYDYLHVSARAASFVQQFAPGYQDALAELVRGFIDAFNAMLREIAAAHPGLVHHADLRGTLTQALDWADELHPSAQGFAKLARGLDVAVRDVIAAQ
jgi:lysophospholipase L1-like esterase